MRPLSYVRLVSNAKHLGRNHFVTYQVQNRNLHHTLIEVSSAILHHLDGYNLLRLEVLAFHYLTEGSLAENIKNEVTIFVVCVVAAENVIDIEDIIAVLIVVAVILGALGWLGKDSARIARTLILEIGVADSVCRWQLCGQRL